MMEFYMDKLSRGRSGLDETQVWLKAVELTHDSIERAKAARREQPPAPPQQPFYQP